MEYFAALDFNIAYKALIFIIVLSVLVFVHELGHYLAAKSVGVKVQKFSIGFGKKIFGYTFKNGEQWQVAMLPLGGYVQLLGMDEELEENLTPEQEKQALYSKKPIARIWVMLAGPLANFIFAIVALFFLFTFAGFKQPSTVVGSVMQDMPAHEAGILPGDKITKINNTNVYVWQDLLDNIKIVESTKPINVEVVRNNQTLNFTINSKNKELKNQFNETETRRMIGIRSSNILIDEKLGVLDSLEKSLEQTYNMSTTIFKAVKKLIVGEIPAENLSGVLTIADESGKAAEQGFYTLILFMVFISINLGILNLLPVPMLDGGHIMYNLIEILTFGKGLHTNIKLVANFIGLALILSLMIFALYNDVVRLILN